jgi:DHA1 family inner membrane transport protein
MSPLLFALFLATFAIGTTEFAVVGLLPDIAAGLGASISQTGLSSVGMRSAWLGFSAASLVGVPSVTAIGHAFGWRGAFWMLAVVGIIAGAALQLWMPASRPSEGSSLRRELIALRRPQVLLAMAMSLLVCASTFAVFTYVAPLLIEETGISVSALPLMLLLFGVGGAAGMVLGGRLGDWKPLNRSLRSPSPTLSSMSR